MPEEKPLTGLAAVRRGDVDQRLGREIQGLIPRDLHPFVGPPLEEFSRRSAVSAPGEALLHPSEEPPSHHWGLHPSIAIEAAHHGEPFLADPGLPAVGGPIPIEIRGLAVAVARFDANDHTVSDIGLQEAVVGIIGGTKKDKLLIVAPDIPVDRLPLPARVGSQGVLNPDRLQELTERLFNIVKGGCRDSSGDELEEIPPRQPCP